MIIEIHPVTEQGDRQRPTQPRCNEKGRKHARQQNQKPTRTKNVLAICKII